MRIVFIILTSFILLMNCKGRQSKSSDIKEDNKNVKESLIKKKDLIPNTEDSLNIKIGQMIMVGLNDRTSLTTSDSLRKEIASSKIGGIIIFEKNISKTNSFQTLKTFISELQKEAPIPLFVSIDEEGGKVHRLKEKYGFVKMPSAAYLGSLNNLDSTYYYSKKLASELSDLGFNINFAPVVDLATNANNPIIAKVNRSFSKNPDTVVAQALTFIKAHHHNDIHTTLKHFPGHGSSAGDTHKGLVDVTKQWQFQELIPYKKIIDAGQCDAIISCHVINCHLDTTCIPSTLSKTITTDILRGVLGFNGVVFSDDMQMHAISKNYGVENSIAMAINAGVDVLVFGNNVNSTDKASATELHTIIKSLLKSGKISESRINESYQRIMALKKRQ